MIKQISEKIRQTYLIFTLNNIREYLTYPGLIYLSLFLSLIGSGAKIVIPTVIGEFVQALSESNNKAKVFGIELSLIEMICLLVTLSAYLPLMAELQRMCLANSESDITKQLALKLIKKTHGLTFEKLNQLMGDIKCSHSDIQNHCSQLPTQIIQNCIPSLLDIILVTAYLWFSYGKSFGIGLFLMAFTNIGIWDRYLIYCTNIEQKMDIHNRSNTNFIQHEFETLEYAETIRVNNHQNLEIRISENYLNKFTKAKTNYTITSSLYNIGSMLLIIFAGIGCALYLYFSDIKKKTINNRDIDDVVFLFSYLLPLIYSITALNKSLLAANNANTYIHKVRQSLNEMLDEHEDNKHSDIPKPLIHEQLLQPLTDKTCLPIKFEHVSFAYNGREETLSDLNFSIPAYSKVAIVGKSGAGKSTILKLLFRFVSPTRGRILIGDNDISGLSLSNLRSLISYMPQNAELFDSQSLEYNVLYGMEKDDYLLELWRRSEKEDIIDSQKEMPQTIDEETPMLLDYKNKDKSETNEEKEFTAKVTNALKQVGLSKYLPHVKEKITNTFSGGEKQLLSLARAVAKNFSVLLVDEPTSNLDSDTEAEVLKNVGEISRHKTTIFITHRLSTIKRADNIIFLEKGKILEQGTHDELIKKEQNYYSMYRKQNG